MTLQRRQAVDI